MSMVGFPLLLIPLAIYNIIAFLMRDVSFAAPLVTLPLPSGMAWPVTLSDVLLTLGILLLLCEVIKGARPGAKYLMDHLLSLWRRRGIRAAAAIRHLDLFPAERAGAGGFPVGHCTARAARHPADVGCGDRKAKRAKARNARTRTAIRSRARAGPDRGCGRRIRVAGSPEDRASRRRLTYAVAGSPVAGIAARQRLGAFAGYATSVIQMICRVRMPAPWVGCWLAV
jgi:hypothetical protein